MVKPRGVGGDSVGDAPAEPLFRTERDLLGPVKVPSGAYFGAFTARAMDNFQVSGLRIDREFTACLAMVKKAAARANEELGYLPRAHTDAMARACDEVASGMFDDNLVLDVFQAGAGTPWNMNMNEVVANRANEILGSPLGSYTPLHPNDHVNMSQSSNDVIPTAMRIASLRLTDGLVQELGYLAQSFRAKAVEFRDKVKSGRTHMRDAVPVTFGQEMEAYAAAVQTSLALITDALSSLRLLPIGGTAVGTGLNTHPRYQAAVIGHLAEETGLDLVAAPSLFEKLQFTTDFLQLMNALSSLSSSLIKVCNDLMMLSSGPYAGLGEVTLPTVEPGSSIMPGKVNPSILECCNMVFMQVTGSRGVVEAASRLGAFELNVYTPVVAYNVFTSVRWLTNAVRTLNQRCVQGLGVNEGVGLRYFQGSGSLATLLAPIIGYDRAAELTRRAEAQGRPVRDVILGEGVLTEGQLSELMEYSTRPNLEVVDRVRRETEEPK